MTQLRTRVLMVVIACVFLLNALPGFADSQVRIVRLSNVEGSVDIDRHTGEGFERAISNMPITQGMLLRTGSDGRAEVEFEEGTVVRLAPDSLLDFQQLSLRDSGARDSTVGVQEGTAYFDVRHKGGDEFTVVSADRQLPITRSAHFRVDVMPPNVKLAVFSGEVAVRSDGEETKVKKGEELTLNADDGTYLAKDISSSEFDAWDKQRSDYHERYSEDSSYNSYPYYGRGDLNQYGGWYNVPGYGQLWQPAGVGYGWDPFYNGYWSWYPGYGYTWVSSYPWGWLPYRYGSWAYVPGWGWGWMPGPRWSAWSPIPRIINPPAGFVRPQPPSPNGPNRPTVFVANPRHTDGPGIRGRLAGDEVRPTPPPNPTTPPRVTVVPGDTAHAERNTRHPAPPPAAIVSPPAAVVKPPVTTPVKPPAPVAVPNVPAARPPRVEPARPPKVDSPRNSSDRGGPSRPAATEHFMGGRPSASVSGRGASPAASFGNRGGGSTGHAGGGRGH